MRKLNRFEKGSGCYKCNACGYLTRRTGDGAQVGVCELCYEIGGCENTMADNSPDSQEYKDAAEDIVRFTQQRDKRNAKKNK